EERPFLGLMLRGRPSRSALVAGSQQADCRADSPQTVKLALDPHGREAIRSGVVTHSLVQGFLPVAFRAGIDIVVDRQDADAVVHGRFNQLPTGGLMTE